MVKHFNAWAWWCALPLGLAASASFAQIAPSADPARIEERITSPNVEFQQLQKNQSYVPDQATMFPVPEGADAIALVIQSMDIQGMTVYSPEQVRPLYAAQLGKEVKLTALYQVAAALQKKYNDDGYTLTKVMVPPQSIANGKAILQVIEGYVSEVEIDPALERTSLLADLEARIRAMRPLNTLTLERMMLIVNALPNMKISAILATPKEKSVLPGGIRLVLKKVEVTEPRGKISVDNNGSRFTGPFQAQANLHIYDMGAEASDLSFTLAGANPWKEQNYAVLSYTLPVFGISGASLNFSAVRAQTQPGDTLESLKIEGDTRTYSVGLTYPIIRQRDETWNVDGGFKWKEAQTDLLGSMLYNDDMRVLNVGTSYSFSDGWQGFNAFDIQASKGLGVLGASQKNDAFLSRADGDPEFEKIEFFTGRVQALPLDFEFYGLISGQYAFDPLLSSEEFGFGGQLGRGYDPSEITGDRGIAATLELRHNNSLDILGSPIKLQPYIFYDAGKVWNIDSGASNHISAISAGSGMRINVNNYWNINLLGAVPLTKPADNPPGYTNPKGTRFLFSIDRSF